MITITAVWFCLITHVVYGTTNITVNNNGNDSVNCCKEGNCACSSLPYALKYIQDNTVINITSKIVTLNGIVGMGSGNLSNITIIGNGATIMCNNTGGVYCESCSDIIIMGITWYQCGRNDSKNVPTQTPALNFTTVSNMTIRHCTFRSSSGCPVYFNNAKEIIAIVDSNFVDNTFVTSRFVLNCAGIYVKSGRSVLNVSIISSKFCRNGCGLSGTSNLCHHYGIIITLGHSCELVNVVIDNTEFSNNSRGLYFNSGYTKSAIVQLSYINVYNNTANGIIISASPYGNSTINIDMSFITLMNNVNPLSILAPSNGEEERGVTITISINNSVFNNNIANDTTDPLYQGTTKLGVLGIALMSTTTTLTIAIVNSKFYNNFNGALGIHLAPPVTECKSIFAWITFTNVTIYNTTTTNDNYIMYAGVAGVSVRVFNVFKVTIKFTDVNFTLNNYSNTNEEVLLIESNQVCSNDIFDNAINIDFTNCSFDSNIAFDHVMFLNIQINSNNQFGVVYLINLNLLKCNIDNNFGGESIVYIHGPSSSLPTINSMVTLFNSTFNNNKGIAFYMHSIITTLIFAQTVLFINNTANSGAAIYFEEVHSISSDNADVKFINNAAEQKGGALYFNLVTDSCDVFSNPFNAFFINNSAKLAGNSIYFSIPQTCQINTNICNESSLLYVPNKFNYSQPIRTKSPPIVTSPYNIKLYPPAIVINNSSNDYAIQQSKMLGEPIQVSASVLDYFDNITEPVIFIVSCITCGNDFVLSTYQITVHDQSLNELKVFPTLSNDVINNTNISITMLALLSPIYKRISASLSIELSSCHAGYLFDKLQVQCICYPYPDIVHCIGDHSEIKIGYWIGFLTEHYTSSICPSNYCNFAKCTETSQGYCELPWTPDGQCSPHRTGVACGECKPGYTLAYDSPKCLNNNKCSAETTILVIVLTILYWIAIALGIFCLMYFWFKIPLGYVYAIIYYYSIVDMLLVNDLSNAISQLVNILSSFAKLTPPLFGQLCFVEGLSGIDQQFIHYTHALAVSLILLIIVLAARYSGRLARFVSPCIIRVICLLLLLSYTSLASTSLQLLRPLTFNNVDEVRTYSSPDIKYFTGRHLIYAIVAILCEVIIVIGLPLLLLLEPFLSQRINFVKIKPLLDEFQECYKGKYRWFAAYYLICRQVIFLIVYVGNGNYYNMLYYLQTACIIIAMIHGWVQPYQNNLLNGLDEVILLILVLVVNVSTFSFLSSVALEVSTVLLLLPLLLLSLVAIRKLLSRCCIKRKRVLRLFNSVEAYGDSEDDDDYNDKER